MKVHRSGVIGKRTGSILLAFVLVAASAIAALTPLTIGQTSALSGYQLVTDDDFQRSATSIGSGANSTSGVGNGWIDFVGNLYNITQPGTLSNTSVNSPGNDPPLNSLYRQQSENYQNGLVRIYGETSEGNNGATARFNPANGGTGYAALLYNGNQIFFYKAVDGVLDTLASGLTLSTSAPANYIFELRATNSDANTTQLTAAIYDQSDPNTMLASKTITDTTPELQTSGSWGTSCYSGCYANRIQTYQQIVGGPIVAGTASDDVNKIYKTGAYISATPSTGGYGSLSYQWYRSTTANFTPSSNTLINGATSLTLQDTGLSPSTTYYYTLVTTDQDTPTPQTAQTNYVQITTMPANSSVIGFIGDSITYGFTTTDPSTQAAPIIEMNQLRADGYHVAGDNEGVSGSTVADWAPNGGMYSAAASNFVADGVDTVQIMLGTNDAKAASQVSAATYQTELQSLITALLSTGTIHHVILEYSPYINISAAQSSYGNMWDSTADTALHQYQTVINGLVNGTTILQGDTQAYSYFQANPSQLGDGIHPTVAGYAALGDLWAAAFERDVFQPGSLSLSSTPTATTVGLASTAPTGGVAPYTYQWYRSTTPNFTPSSNTLINGATSDTLSDSGLSPNTTYYYKVVYGYTADANQAVTSGQFSITTLADSTSGAGSATSSMSATQGATLTKMITVTSSHTSVGSTDTSTLTLTSSSAPTAIGINSVDSNGYDSSGNMTTTSHPTITGTAPPYAQVTLTFHSTPTYCETNADANGNWSCTLGQALPAGEHTVDIAAVTTDGQTLTFPEFHIHVLGDSTTTTTPVKTISNDANKTTSHRHVWEYITAGVVLVGLIWLLIRPKRHRTSS